MNTGTGRSMVTSQLVPPQSPSAAGGVGTDMYIMQEKVLYLRHADGKPTEMHDVRKQAFRRVPTEHVCPLNVQISLLIYSAFSLSFEVGG